MAEPLGRYPAGMSERGRETDAPPEGRDPVEAERHPVGQNVDRSLIRDRLSRTALERLRDNQRAAERVARLRAAGQPGR